jgi:hypothetical protein
MLSQLRLLVHYWIQIESPVLTCGGKWRISRAALVLKQGEYEMTIDDRLDIYGTPRSAYPEC